MKNRFWLIFAILFIYFAASGAAHADRRLELFLEKFNAVDGLILPMAHADSPLYPYYHRDFEDGLDESRRVLLRKAQEAGNCVLVDKLVVDGFLSLFAFLKPAIADYERYVELKIMISLRGRPARGRCHYHSYMSKIFDGRRREVYPPVDFLAPDTKILKWGNEPIADLKTLKLALSLIGKAALCDDYRLAIADLIGIVNRPGGMALTPQEELYLVERARLHNLADGEYDKAISRLSKHFDSGKAFSRLRDASKARKLEAIPFAIKGYWRDKCRQIERSRRGYR